VRRFVCFLGVFFTRWRGESERERGREGERERASGGNRT